MAKETKDAKRARRAEARAKRDAAKDEIRMARIRTGIGFAGAYVVTQVLPSFAPSLKQHQAAIDFVVGAAGAAGALLDDGPLGDVAVGVGLVGGIQTFDNVGQALTKFFQTAQQPAVPAPAGN